MEQLKEKVTVNHKTVQFRIQLNSYQLVISVYWLRVHL